MTDKDKVYNKKGGFAKTLPYIKYVLNEDNKYFARLLTFISTYTTETLKVANALNDKGADTKKKERYNDYFRQWTLVSNLRENGFDLKSETEKNVFITALSSFARILKGDNKVANAIEKENNFDHTKINDISLRSICRLVEIVSITQLFEQYKYVLKIIAKVSIIKEHDRSKRAILFKEFCQLDYGMILEDNIVVQLVQDNDNVLLDALFHKLAYYSKQDISKVKAKYNNFIEANKIHLLTQPE